MSDLEKTRKKNAAAGIMMTMFAAFGGILYGYDTGVISGVIAMPNWLQTFGVPNPDYPGPNQTPYIIHSSTESLVVSILSAGTFFGALASGYTADWLGRRWAIISSCLVFCIGVAMQTASTEIPLFVVGRVLAGLGVGVTSTVVPMYQGECAPRWIRGAVVSLYQWCITIGLLLASVVNNATKDRPDHSAYRITIGVQFIWAFVLSIGIFLLPESPRWLIRRGDMARATRSLERLTGLSASDPELEIEIEDINANLEQERQFGESSFIDCFKSSENKIRLRTLTGIFIQAWQQLTGVNFIFYYGTTFFKASGIQNPFLVSVATNVVNVFMTLPGVWGIERFGRRKLLLIGAAGMCICEFIVAIVGVTVSTDNLNGQHVLVAFVCIYIAFFAATWGPIAYVVIAEIFPLQVRAKAMAMSSASNWLWNFGIGYATPYLVNQGAGSAGLQVKVFFIWGSTCLCCFIFAFFCVPETKGLSLEQIDLMYQHTYPLTAGPYRRRLLAEDVHASQQDKIPVKGEVQEHEAIDEKV
jgi:SP family sugar:H+ symporter-like MFS transporter